MAAVGEISLDAKDGIIRAPSLIWIALDPGIVLNTDSVLAQTEGNVIFGLSQTFKVGFDFRRQGPSADDFYDLPGATPCRESRR